MITIIWVRQKDIPSTLEGLTQKYLEEDGRVKIYLASQLPNWDFIQYRLKATIFIVANKSQMRAHRKRLDHVTFGLGEYTQVIETGL